MATGFVEHLPPGTAVPDPAVEANERVRREQVPVQTPPHGLGVHKEPAPAAGCAAASLERGGERVRVRRHAAVAHAREVLERPARAPGGVDPDEGVPGERVPGDELREAREECVGVGRGGDGGEGEEEEVGEAERGGGEVAGGEQEGVALERVGGGAAATEAGEERRQRDGEAGRHRSGMASLNSNGETEMLRSGWNWMNE